MGRGGRPVRWVVVAAAALAAVPATCTGQVVGPELPANDLEDSIPGGQVVSSSPAVVIPHPTLAPVPKATCGPGSHPLNDPMQGRGSSAHPAGPEGEEGWAGNNPAGGPLAD